MKHVLRPELLSHKSVDVDGTVWGRYYDSHSQENDLYDIAIASQCDIGWTSTCNGILYFLTGKEVGLMLTWFYQVLYFRRRGLYVLYYFIYLFLFIDQQFREETGCLLFRANEALCWYLGIQNRLYWIYQRMISGWISLCFGGFSNLTAVWLDLLGINWGEKLEHKQRGCW